ncbi:MAG: hypothetical protein Q7U37_04755 [Gallionella sp.]|jgi:hypothetical protein|nr:hypothetical protein [Gallionella sp.]MDP1941049.1 hypothetical protein [Gallionella sp.]
MKFCKQHLLVLLFLTNSLWAAEPVNTDAVQAQMLAAQGKQQAYADTIWHYLSAEHARKRQLDEAVDSLYKLAFLATANQQPDVTTVGLPAWQEALVLLLRLDLPPAVLSNLKTLEQGMRAATRALSGIPASDGSSKRLVERQQALMAAASALSVLGQQASHLDGQLQSEARRAAAAANLLGSQMLMLPAVKKGGAP